ncbi:MAG TPA: site-specific DNA-methyltransferase [Candidatus Hydrogenedens sp.]|nr:site-specific DNA-methyltransferase [Candidatus Hydrogenedens sp.]HOK08588.1 site-specific DNA-methyltransferase [Candidatus Hydrogenedens sp.]HOL21108.1 site-specific DNA-methyltransferase [Candidatus Hydrogenedens sp.]HPP57742.1 site-specific DNA-methyltransferase [Candidatus Hydrogenedens sp.]
MSVKSNRRAERNRTITLTKREIQNYKKRFLYISHPVSVGKITNKIIHQDLFKIIDFLPTLFVDLLFIDPPYNLRKQFNANQFREMSEEAYEDWIESWLNPLRRILKPTASIYICGDWKSSSAIYRVMSKYFKVQNRITWEREKGRGALSNWKNCSEDIWFGTVSNKFYFNSKAVMLKRKVVAPYRDEAGKPKDWKSEQDGNYRLTYPSNLWTDITVPFWSMPENTDHPTQKPEKLVAKIILASSKEGDFVFDPFSGVGTTCVVAKKLGRHYCGVEIDETYCCLAEKRLELAEEDKTIQGYVGGVFWERNTMKDQKRI